MLVERVLGDVDVVSTRCGLCVMTVLLLGMHAVNGVVKRHCVPLSVKAKGPQEVWKWSNLAMSWLHALVVGTWDLLCFYYYPEMMDDLINFKNAFSFYMVVFSTSYFVYDFGDMIYNRKIFKMWELTLHHIAVISIFVYHLLAITCIGYNIIALLCEVNSFFLHSRKLLQMLDVSFTNPFYLSVAVINLITFVTFRGYSLIRISYGMYIENNFLSQTYYIVLCCSMFIMNMLNPILFWILIKNDFIRNFQKKKEKFKTTNGNISSQDHDTALSRCESLVKRARKLTDSLNIDEYKIE